MQDAVDVATVRSADVDDIGIENRSVLLIEIHPLLHNSLGLFCVIKTRATITRLNARAEILREMPFIEIKVFMQRFDCCSSTAAMVTHFVDALIERGIAVRQCELSTIDIGKLAIALVDAATVVIGSPTVLAGPHPTAAYAAFLANALRPKTRFLSIIGSYGWGGKTVETLAGMIPKLKVEIIDPVLCKGVPSESDFKALDELAATIAEKHKEHNLI